MRTFATRTALVTAGAVAFFGMGAASASAADLNSVLDSVGLGDAVTTNVNGPGQDAVSETDTATDPMGLLDESTLAGLDPTGSLPITPVSDLVSMDGLDSAVGPSSNPDGSADMIEDGMRDWSEGMTEGWTGGMEGSGFGLQDALAPAAQVDPGHVSATPQRERQVGPVGDVAGLDNTVGSLGDQVNGAVTGLGDNVGGETLPTEQLPTEGLPTEGLPTEQLPTLPTETLPTETLPAETLPGETLPGETLPGEGGGEVAPQADGGEMQSVVEDVTGTVTGSTTGLAGQATGLTGQAPALLG